MNHKPAALTEHRAAGSEAGFTVIELMIVVTIVSILAVIAMPAYVEYATRSKVSEAMGFMGEAKTSVSEYYYTYGQKWPKSNSDAGLPESDDYDAYDFILSLEIATVGSSDREGTITVTLDLPNTDAHEKRLQLVPSTSTGEIVWTCQPAPDNGVENKYAPANCRI